MSARPTELSRLRRSPAAAEAIVRDLVPPRYIRSVLAATAHSLKHAHEASSSKWGLRLNRESVMLKVGFVEVLQFGDGWFHQLVRSDLVASTARADSKLVFNEPPYVNAPSCETCDMPLSRVRVAYPALQPAHEAAIDVAARSRRHMSTTHDHSPGLVIFLSEMLGLVLPQPEYLEVSPSSVTIPEEVPSDEEFVEGAVTQVLVNRYERDPLARAACIRHYGLTCAACGVTMSDAYGDAVAGLIHVHHITPIATVGGSASVDPVRDLRPVCPNCHAVIHAVHPPRSIEEVQEMLQSRARSPTRTAEGER